MRRAALQRALVVLLALVSAGSSLAGAQGVQPTSGVIEGRVKDRSGNPLGGARIVITGPSRRDVQADRDGFYRSDQLSEGVYGVEARVPGHVSSLFEGMRLRPGETLRLDFNLAVGSPNSFAMTRMPVVDTRARGARYWLTREDLERLPSAGILRPLVSLLPRSEVVLVDETELAVPRTEVAGALGLGLERMPPEMLSSVTVSSADSAPAQRSADRLQLLTRSSVAKLHGSAMARFAPGDLQDDAGNGQSQLERSVRPTAGIGAVPAERFRLFGGWASHRDVETVGLTDMNVRQAAFDGVGEIEVERFDRTRLGRLDFGPPERWELRALWLDTRSEVELGERLPVPDTRFAEAERRLAGAALERVTEGRLGYTLALRSDDISLLSRSLEGDGGQLRERSNREISSYAEINRGRHPIAGSLGWLDSDLVGSAVRDEDEAFAIGVEDRWSLGAKWVAYIGVRAQRLLRTVTTSEEAARLEDTVVDPRVSLAYDVGGDGQLGFRFSAGRERTVRPTLISRPIGELPSTGTLAQPADVELQPAVEFLAVGGRYQLIPGLTFEGELSRRERRRPLNAGNEVIRLSDIDPLEGVLAGTFSALSEFRLDEFFGEENRVRLQTSARIGERLNSWALWELRDLEQARGQDGRVFELGTIQHLRVTGTYHFENGIGAGLVFRYLDGFGVATPRVGSLVLSPSPDLGGATSLAQLDVSFDYRVQLGSLLGTETLSLALRFEILNALDRRNVTVSATALDGQGVATGLGLAQEPRSVWLGLGFVF